MERTSLRSFRKEFPITEKHIYLDHAGIAPISQRVSSAVREVLEEAQSMAAFSYARWSERTAAIRKTCAGLINAGPEEVAFVRNTSHGLSLVAGGLDWKRGENVLVCEGDFPSNIYPWKFLEKRGVEVRPYPVRGGGISVEDIEGAIDGKTRLLTISSVQFTNGFRCDLKRMGAVCETKGILFCVDAIQSLGLLPMDVRENRIDFLSADAHKWLLGPEGIGIFYCRRERAELLSPLLVGWKSVQKELEFERPEFELKNDALRFEEGSQNLLGIAGVGAAVDLILEVGIKAVMDRVQELGDSIFREAEARGFAVITPRERKDRGGIVTVKGPFDAGMMRDALRKRNIMVNMRAGGLRISPHFYNTEEEIVECFREIDHCMAAGASRSSSA